MSAVGAFAGSLLLIVSPDELFERIVPALILVSCAVLAAQPLLARALRPAAAERPQDHSSPWLVPMQFFTALYGGYFSAGFGIMMLAVLGIYLNDGLQRLNVLKGVLSLVVGAVTAASYALLGHVVWSSAVIMAAACLLGGQAGVFIARRLSASVLRTVVVAFGVIVAVYLMR